MGRGPYYSVTLAGTFRLQDLLNQLYVLVPVLDAEKYYWMGQDDVEKLLRKGEGWLGSHPHMLRLKSGMRSADPNFDDLLVHIGGFDQTLSPSGDGYRKTDAWMPSLFATSEANCSESKE